MSINKLEYEIVDYGIMYPDYFQGIGTAFTDWMWSTYGIGDSFNEALLDAISQVSEQLYANGYPESTVLPCCDQLDGELVDDNDNKCVDDNDNKCCESYHDYCDSDLPYYHVGIYFSMLTVTDTEQAPF
jgi:hypothetical protein